MPHHNHRSVSSFSNPRFRKQYRYKSRCSNSSGTTVITNRSSVTRKKKTSTAWENIVIHYLQKLKNYWNSTNNEKETSNREKSYQTQKKSQRKSNSKEVQNCSSRTSKDRVDYCLAGKRKALNIVSNALEYGLANGIVSRNGNYYWIKDRLIPKRVSNHRMNPTTSPAKTVAKPQEQQPPQTQPKGNSKKMPNKGRGKTKKPVVKKGRKPLNTRRGKPKKMPTRARIGRRKGGFCSCRKCNDLFKKFSLLEDE